VAESFGGVLKELREEAHLSLRALAKKVYCSHGHIADIEVGRRSPGVQLAEALDDVLGAEGRLKRLAPEGDSESYFRVRSHKFIAGYLGPKVLALVESVNAVPGERDLLSDYWAIPVEHPEGEATLHIWGHGATIFHVVEEADWPNITSLALWRYESYERDLKWAEAQLPCPPLQPYVLSLYWLIQPAWTGERLETALRLICAPRILVGENPATCSPEGVEAALLRDGFPVADNMLSFGVADTAVGYASWSGVVYHPVDDTRALREQDLVSVELTTQAVWQYCSWISHRVEMGEDPEVPEGYGWRWLRAARSRLMTARPQETGPHRMMRESILATCGLPEMLEPAITTLRELS
jgi:transcriptional regulator with XRE-family HTH domain